MALFGETSVDLGAFTTNSFGEIEVKFRSDSDNDSLALGDIIPEGLDIRDLSAVEVLLSGEKILEGVFN